LPQDGRPYTSFRSLPLPGGAIGIALLANQLKATQACWLAWVAQSGMLAGIAIIAAYTYLRLSVVGFNEATLGLTTNYQMSENMIYAYYLVTLAATFVASLALTITGWLRRVGLTVAALSAILFLLTLIPAVGPAMPPIVFIFLWVPLGIGLLRR
jgi:hypothetical protein